MEVKHREEKRFHNQALAPPTFGDQWKEKDPEKWAKKK